MTAESPIRTVFTVSAGGPVSTIPIVPGQVASFDVPASGVRGLKSYAYLLSVRSSEGFTEHLRVPASDDKRNLGVMIRFSAVLAHAADDEAAGAAGSNWPVCWPRPRC